MKADLEGFVQALKISFKDRKQISITLIIAAITYTLIILLSFPQYSIGVLSRDLTFLTEAVTELSINTYATSGLLGMTLTVLYAVMTGITVSLISFQSLGSLKSFRDISAATPGLLAAGCAGCGAGLLGFIGFTGALATLPFEGNLVRFAGISLLIYFIARTGDPRTCKVSAE